MPPIAAAAAPLATSFAISAIGGVASAFVMQGVSRLLFGNPELKANLKARQEQITAAVAPHRWIYGEVIVAGNMIYSESYGVSPPNEFMSLILVVAAHQVEEISTVWVDDAIVPLQGDDETPVQSSKYFNNFWIYKHLGSPDQAADPELVSQSAGLWTNDHRCRGRAYIHVQLRWNAEVYQGIPKVRVLVKGKQTYDTGTQTVVYNSNPALAVRDYLTEALKYPVAEVDDTLFGNSRQVCGEDVPLKGGGTQDRYRVNGTLELDERPADVIGDLQTACAGTFTWINGLYGLTAGEAKAPVLTLTESDLRGGVTIVPRRTGRDLFNTARAVFGDQRNEYQPVDMPPVQSANAIAEDNNEEIVRDFELAFEDNYIRAQRLIQIELRRNREQISFVFPCKLRALQLTAWDTVLVDLPRLGWVGKKFRVTDWRFAEDWGIDLTLAEESDAMWDWDPNTDEQDYSPAPDTILPDPFTQGPPTAVTVTESTKQDARNVKELGSVRVKWSPPADTAYLERYEARVRTVADPVEDWSDSQIVDSAVNQAIFGNLRLTDDYEGAVRALGTYVKSAWVTGTSGAISGDLTPPGMVTSVELTAPAIRSVRVRWVNPIDDDFAEAKLYARGDAGAPSESDLRHTHRGQPGAAAMFVYENLNPGSDVYFFFATVDISGNQSAYSSAQGPIAAKRAITDDVTDAAVTNPKIEDDATARTASAIQDGDVSIPATWTTLASAATSSDGSSVQLHYTGQIKGGVDGSSTITEIEFRLRRDGTTIRQWNALPFEEPRVFVSFQHRDTTPPSGSNTYTIQAQRSAGTVDGSSRNNELSLTESRK